MSIQVYLTPEGIKTLVRVLDHAIGKAEPTGGSAMREIDYLCRRESAARWRALRTLLNNKLPKRQRI